MTHIDRIKSQMIYYCISTNLQIIHHKLSIIYQKKSMNVYPEISPMKKFLIHPNINTEKHLEAVNTPISNWSLIKSVPSKQKEIGSVTLFGLIRFSAEQSPQMLQKGFSNYYVTTSHTPASFKKTPVKVTTKLHPKCSQRHQIVW